MRIHRLAAIERRGAMVPALWGLFNGVIFAVGGAMGAQSTILYEFAGSIAITELFGAAVFFSQRRHPLATQQFAVRNSGGSAMWVALTCLMGLLAGGYHLWMAPPAAATFIVTVYVVVHQRRPPPRRGAPPAQATEPGSLAAGDGTAPAATSRAS